MPRYRYRAINEGGEIVKGEITALHGADLQAQLRASGLSLIRFSTVRRRALRLASLPTRELINLLFHMQMLLRAGVPLIGALQDLRDGADSLELRQVAASLMDRIQNGSTLALWARDNTDLTLGGRLSSPIDPAMFAAVNSFFIIVLTPALLFFFRFLRTRGLEPSTPAKLGLGMLLTAVSCGMLVMAPLVGGDKGRVSALWLVSSYFVVTLGELCLSPIGLSMVTKLAPLRLASLMMGAWFGFVALANYAAGFIGSFVGESGAMAIFGGIALAAVISALILLTMANRLVYWMHGAEGPAKEPEEQEQKLQSATV